MRFRLVVTCVAVSVAVLLPITSAHGHAFCFPEAGLYPVDSGSVSVFAVDIDSDGDQDVVVANYGAGNVSVLKNNGDGTFSTPFNYATRGNPVSVFAADLDGDGDQDVVVANDGTGGVSVLKNNGDGVLAAEVHYAVGTAPTSVFAADLDRDGDQDIVVANGGSNNVSVLKNDGDGMFASAVNYAVGIHPQSVFAADLDGDGDPDLAVANGGSNNVSVLNNSGDGIFSAAVNYAVGDDPWSICAADLDGDGDQDLVVANSGTYPDYDGIVSVLKNNGDGTFATAVNYQAGEGPRSVFAADLDGDGDQDLAVANYRCGSVTVLKNDGDGMFASAVSYAVGIHPQSVVVTDLDGDGDPDLAVANRGRGENVHSLSVLKNNGDGTYAAPVNYMVGTCPLSVIAADLDGDGDLDLAVANSGYEARIFIPPDSVYHYIDSGNVSVLINNGDGTFAPAVNYAADGFPHSVIAADVDGDGDQDLAVANSLSGNVSVLKSNGDGTFAAAVNYAVGTAPTSVFAADLDRDGDQDLAVAGDILSVLKNNGDGTFAQAYAVGPGSGSVVAADLDGDNDVDLVLPGVWVLKNNGDGTFAAAVNYPASGGSVVAADLNVDGDGDQDLAVANSDPGTNHIFDGISVLKNNGDGTYASAVNYAAGSFPHTVIAADLDSDGDQDLAVANACIYPERGEGGNVSILINCTNPDRSRPTLTLGVLQNPILPSHLELQVLSNERLRGIPTLTANLDTLDLYRDVQDWETNFAASYRLTGEGLVTLRTTATDLAGNVTDTSSSFESFPTGPAGGLLKSSDGELWLSLPRGALTLERYLLLFHSQVSSGRIYDLRPASVALQAPAELRFACRGRDGSSDSPGRLGIWQERNDGRWEPLPTFYDERTGTLITSIVRLGRFQVRAGSSAPLPRSLQLAQNYPNPFNAGTTIQFTLDHSSPITLEVFNILGQWVIALVDGEMAMGTHQVAWDGRDEAGQPVASGVYYYRLRTGEHSQTRPMVLLK